MDSVLLVGIVGAAILLLAFVFDELNIVPDDSAWLHGLNFCGAAFLLWYAVLLHSWPFIVLEGIWALVALWYLLKRLASDLKNR